MNPVFICYYRISGFVGFRIHQNISNDPEFTFLCRLLRKILRLFNLCWPMAAILNVSTRSEREKIGNFV